MVADLSWIKMNVYMFRHPKLLIIDSMENSNLIYYVWTSSLLLAGECNMGGCLYISGDMPYTIKNLSIVFRRKEEEVKEAYDVLMNLNMIEKTDDEVFKIRNWEKYQSVESLDKIRKQTCERVARYRERKREEKRKAEEQENKSEELREESDDEGTAGTNEKNTGFVNLEKNNTFQKDEAGEFNNEHESNGAEKTADDKTVEVNNDYESNGFEKTVDDEAEEFNNNYESNGAEKAADDKTEEFNNDHESNGIETTADVETEEFNNEYKDNKSEKNLDVKFQNSHKSLTERKSGNVTVTHENNKEKNKKKSKNIERENKHLSHSFQDKKSYSNNDNEFSYETKNPHNIYSTSSSEKISAENSQISQDNLEINNSAADSTGDGVELSIYCEKITGKIGILDICALNLAVHDHGKLYVKQAIDKAIECGKVNMAYINGILKNWKREGYPCTTEADSDPGSRHNSGYGSINKNGIEGIGGKSYGKRGTSKGSGNGSGGFEGVKPREPRKLTEDKRKEYERNVV